MWGSEMMWTCDEIQIKDDFVERAYEGKIGGGGVSGRPSATLIIKVDAEQRVGRQGIEWAERECQSRENWNCASARPPFEGSSAEETWLWR